MPVQRYLQKLTKYPPHVTAYKILSKIAVKLKVEAESLKANLFSTDISDKQLSKSLVDSFESFSELLNHIRNRQQPNFFFQPSDRSKMVDMVKSYYPNALKQTIADADKICEHVFNLLGSGDVSLGEKIDWHIDFKTGWRWKLKYYKKIDCTSLDNPCDVKVPWELSRCQHFVTLGKAYWYNGDEKYVKEFVVQVNDWIDSNPPKEGVNWACTMDVAIRVVNWIWGYYLFKDSPTLTDDFLLKFLRSILAHERHIMNNLENKEKVTTNHYLSNLVGLVYLGMMFPEFKEAKRWREFGLQEIIEEMNRQVYPDGVDFEASIGYHKLVTELFLSATILCLKNGAMFKVRNSSSGGNIEQSIFPIWYMERLEKMIEFVMYYTKPDGTTPQIGDSDDGRLHILSNFGNWNKVDHRYLLPIGAVLFNRLDFKKATGDFHEEAFWLLGEVGLNKFNLISDIEGELSSKAFPDAGIYVMRKKDLYMFIDCGANNPNGKNAHAHNDTLSFELFVGDKTFIVDPGAYIYTADAEMRNLFRSTAYHNTIVVDGQEMNRFYSWDIFSIMNDAVPKVNQWRSNSEYDFLDALHTGYERLSNPVTHCRQIIFNKRKEYWIIKDILTGKGKHVFELYFHFAPMKIAVNHEEPPFVKSQTINGNDILVIPMETDGLKFSLNECWVSYSYGKKITAYVLRYSKIGQVPIVFMTVIYPICVSQISVENIKEEAEMFYQSVVN